MIHRNSSGFTAIELIVATAIAAAAGFLVLWQKNDIDASTRDTSRKTSINAMYYSLEEVYYSANGNTYPERLSSEKLRGIDPTRMSDPYGIKIGDSGSSLRYEPHNCSDGNCKGYTLRADLEKEADFVKKSRNN